MSKYDLVLSHSAMRMVMGRARNTTFAKPFHFMGDQSRVNGAKSVKTTDAFWLFARAFVHIIAELLSRRDEI